MIKNVFLERWYEENTKYTILKTCGAFVLGFSGSLFVEHITIFNIIISLGIAVYFFLRFKKFNFINLGYLTGSVISAVIMFSNSAYGIISAGDDSYRTSFLVDKDISFLVENVSKILELFFVKNSMIFAVISILCVIAAIIRIKLKKDIPNKLIIFSSSAALLICSYVMLLDNGGVLDINCRSDFGFVFYLVLVCVYCLSFVLFVTCFFDDKVIKRKIFFLLLCTGIVVAPFALVTPFGGRCLLTPHIFLVIIGLIILNYISDNIPHKAVKISECAFVVVLSGVLVFYSYIYLDIHGAVKQRESIVEEQKRAGCDTIVVPDLPHDEYVWRGNPDNVDLLQTFFKLYYGIDESTKVECRDYTEYGVNEKEFEEYLINN